MNLLGSWIDADAVSDIARELTGDEVPEAPAADTSPAVRLVPDDPGDAAALPEPAFQASGLERERMRGFLQTVRQRAESSGLIPQRTAAAGRSPAPDPAPPAGSLAARARTLTDWIRRELNPSAVRLVDALGCPVGGSDAADPAGAFPLRPADGHSLCVIDADTANGRYSLVFAVASHPAPAVVESVRQRLRLTVDPGSAPPPNPPARERW